MPQRGEIWWVNLDPVVGHEQAGIRPALIISSDRFNALAHGLCMVLPITTTHAHEISTHIPVPAPPMPQASMILCEQLRTVSVDRLKTLVGRVEPALLDKVSRVLRLILVL